jgi:teichuronic acid biosynthesis glycosyltransferase TuaG
MTRYVPVSVVIPVFNARETMLRAVRSVIEQTHLPGEIIIVDDASTDGTWEEISILQEKTTMPVIKAIRLEKNSGPAEARNAGWNIVTGEYIAFLDADDVWHPRKLELQYGWMMAHPEMAIAGHRCEVMSPAGPVSINQVDLESKVCQFSLSDFLLGNRYSTPTVILRRSLPYRFAKGMRYCEDYQLWLQIVARHTPVCWIDLPLAYLFKAKYGEGGLSGHLWRMEEGELSALTSLVRTRQISTLTWLMACIWSLGKFMRRILWVPFVYRKPTAEP